MITKKPIKYHMILLQFIHGKSLNRFEAAKHGDWVLNSTVSYIERSLGLHIHRTPENVPCRTGDTVRVMRYSIPESERQKAAEVLASDLVRIGKFHSKHDALASIGYKPIAG